MTGQDKLDERLLRYLLEEMETSEREEVEAWMEENDQNRNYFRDFQKTHLELLWSVQARETRTDFNTFRRKLRKPLSVKLWYRVAAVVVLMVSIGGWFVWSESSKNEWLTRNEMIQPGKVQAKLYLSSGAAVEIGGEARDLKEQDGTSIKVSETGKLSYEKERANASAKAVMNRVEVPRGGEFSLVLEDGTQVWLNAESELRYPIHFMGKERVVYLKGEAFFEVKQNGKVPFVISTEKANIKVLGTKFNVFAYKGHEEFNTSLVEGSVKVYQGESDADALDITPHECVFLSDGKLVKSYFDNSDFLLWKEGIYAFDDVPFSYIIKKLELYYDITIIQKNKKLDQYRFSGKFRQRDGVESVLQTLQKVYYFSFVKDEENNCITIR